MDNNEILQITGTIEDIIYRNNDNGYSVVDVDVKKELITATGVMPTVEVGMEVRLYGRYKSHPSYGLQFCVETFEPTIPTTSNGILRYLSSGAIKGVGSSTATMLVKEFGEKTLEVLENEPERVALLKGISEKKANDISKQLKESIGIRELMLYLSEFQISANTAVRIYKYFGNRSLEYIRDNPYTLCDNGLRVSFEMADMIAKKQDRPIDDKNRVRAGIAHVLNHNKQNGHTCLPEERLIATTTNFLQVDTDLVKDALNNMIFDASLMREKFDDKNFIFLPEMHRAETFIANRIKLMQSFPAAKFSNTDTLIEKIQQEDNIQYAEKQIEAIKSAMEKGFLILTGGPGTGKTTTLNAIIKILEKNGQTVLLTAPTGRASQRMGEVTGKEAKTIHRLLEVAYDKDDKPVFKKNEKNLLKCDALIVDEVSMVDSQLFASLIEALPFATRLILVGDSDQLPSVGPGNVLGDLIESGLIPVVRLNEIFRQAQQSLIVTNAHKIVNGEIPILNSADKDFFFLQRNTKSELSAVIADLCANRLPKAYGYSPFENIQVLAPSKKGELGTAELNHKLQAALNPKDDDKAEITIGSKTFRTGDKVMQIKNNYDIRWFRENGETGEGIFNGDIGIITKIDRKTKSLVVKFFDKIARYTFEFAGDLDFAYAITVHKSQGNEFDAVIIPMFSGPPQLYYRNLLYTAVTRAKKTLVLVGNPSTVEYMVNNNRRTKRYSGLKEFLLRDDTLY